MSALQDSAGSGPQPGLFVLWERAGDDRERVLRDLREHFELVHVHEVHWTPHRAMENFQRLYSDLDVRGVYHVFNKGSGPFLAVALLDPAPAIESRMTSRGRRVVNARFLDAKLRYREWMNGLGVHCAETARETSRDLTMLLGPQVLSGLGDDPGRWNGSVERVHRDVTGARGWSSETELFEVLNNTVNYVLIGGNRDSEAPLSGSSTADFLTDEYRVLRNVLNARPVLGTAPREGGRFRIPLRGIDVEIGIRLVGDSYFDPRWARSILADRVLTGAGVFRPPEPTEFEALAYHLLVHKPDLDAGEREQVARLAQRSGCRSWHAAALADRPRAKALLDGILSRRGYAYTRPADPTVFFDYRMAGYPRSLVRRSTAGLRRRAHSAMRRITGFATAYYRAFRDRVLLRAPWLRDLKRAVTAR